MKFSMKEFLKQLRSNEFILKCQMPLGYVAGYPILQDVNGELCIIVPFLKYKITGKPDKTAVYPIKYTVTFVPKVTKAREASEMLPISKNQTNFKNRIINGSFVRFENLKYNPYFAKLRLDEPVGLFRHEAVKDLNKEEFEALKDKLYELYDSIINAQLEGREVQTVDKLSFKQLISRLMEPSLLGLYKLLDEPFYNKYLKV